MPSINCVCVMPCSFRGRSAAFAFLLGGLSLALATVARADDHDDFFRAFRAAQAAEAKSDLVQAGQFYQQARELAPRVFGPNDKRTATVINNLANIKKQLGDFAAAERLHDECLTLRKSILPPNDPDIAQSLGNIANLYLATGRYAEAAKKGEEALAIRKTRLGAENLEVADNLNNLAAIFHTQGKFERAEPLLQESFRIRVKLLGRNRHDVAQSLNNLGNLYSDLGQFEKADRDLKDALDIYQHSPDSTPLDIAAAQNNLGILYATYCQNQQSLEWLQKSLETKQAKLGPNHPDVALALNNLAVQDKLLGKYPEAEQLYLRSLKIRENAFGPAHPDVASSLINLANVYNDLGRYQEAEPLYLRARDIALKLDSQRPELAKTLQNLGLLHAAVGNVTAAAEELDFSRHIVRKHAAQILPLLSDREQLNYLKNDANDLGLALSLPWKFPNAAGLTELSAGWLANSKGVAQEMLAQKALLERDNKKPELVPLVRELVGDRRRLANLINLAPQPGEEAAHKQAVDKLSTLVDELANRMVHLGGSVVAGKWVAMNDIRRGMPAKSMLVDIARFYPVVFGAKPGEPHRLAAHYMAWVTPPVGNGETKIVDLGDAADIDKAIAEFQEAFRPCQNADRNKNPIGRLGEVAAEKELHQSLAALASKLLLPLQPILETSDEIILCPDAGLWLIPWAALPLDEKTYAIEKWNIRFVSSARDLTPQAIDPAIKAGTPRIFTNPNYDLPAGEAAIALAAILGTQIPAKPLVPLAPAAPSALVPPAPAPPAPAPPAPAAVPPAPAAPATYAPPSPATFEHSLAEVSRSAKTIGQVSRLPGTAAEAEAIIPSLTRYAGEPKVYSDQQALEGVFKHLAPPRVLVLSTHGFFIADQQVNPVADALFVPVDAKTRAAAPFVLPEPLENPLVRCGLMLTGCNNRRQLAEMPNMDDGVLTGLEIISVNLRGTELVVLSACETGLGQVNNGEGVAGLRQAFQLAGAQSVVSTLWQIPDQATAQLMNDFFGNLAAGQSKSESLRNAQLSRIKARRAKYGAAHPLYWGAFTLTGQ